MLVTKKVNGQEATAWNELQFIENKGKLSLGFEEACSKGQELLLIALSSRIPPPHTRNSIKIWTLSTLKMVSMSFSIWKLLKCVLINTPASPHYRHTIVEIKGTHYRKCVNVFMNVESSLKLPPFCGIKYSTYTYSLSMFILCETKTVYYITHRYIYIYY